MPQELVGVRVKEVRTRGEHVIPALPGWTSVLDLKLRIQKAGLIPAAAPAARVHLAHHGRLLRNEETLISSGVAHTPAVVLLVPSISSLHHDAAAQTQPRATAAAAAFSSAAAATSAASAAASTAAAALNGARSAAIGGLERLQARLRLTTPQPSALASEPQATAQSAHRTAHRTAHHQTAHQGADAESNEMQCRICFGGVEAGRLFRPCRCRGSARYVHAHCLNHWRAASANRNSFTSCDQCGYQYQVQRLRAAQFLVSELLVWVVTGSILVLSTLIATQVPGR